MHPDKTTVPNIWHLIDKVEPNLFNLDISILYTLNGIAHLLEWKG